MAPTRKAWGLAGEGGGHSPPTLVEATGFAECARNADRNLLQ